MDSSHLTDRVVSATLGMVDTLSIALGHELGLYRALATDGPIDPDQLAEHAGIHPRYAREWLEQQAITGFVGQRSDGRFELPPDHIAILVDRDDLGYLAPLTVLLAAAATRFPELLDAYRTGGGVGWDRFGPRMREAQSAGNRPWFLGPLVQDWLPSIDGLSVTLDGGGRVLEVGCGEGWASIAIATRWPAARVTALDIDQPSVDAATRHAAEAGVADRVTVVSDPADLTDDAVDLVLALECLHDMADPVDVLRSIRERVTPGAVVLVMDERAADRFDPPGDEVERLLYGWSLLICLPDSMSHPDSVATGTVMRPDTVRHYATAAGFSAVEILPIEHDLWRFYRLHG